MTPCGSIQSVHLLHDGELPAALQGELLLHIDGCSECAAELAELRSLSPAFAQLHAGSRLSMIERARLDQELAKELNSEFGVVQWVELQRTARMLSAIAASILLISTIWLFEIPSGHTTIVSPAVVAVSPRDFNTSVPGSGDGKSGREDLRYAAATPAWERIAETLRVDPRPEDGGAFDIGVADARGFNDNSADGAVADWIIAGLGNGSAGIGRGIGGAVHAAP